MCGRYTVFTEDEIIEMTAIVAEVSRRFGSGAVNTGEIFPTNHAPILVMENNRLTPFPVFWGFPKWDGKGTIINARCESALQKPTFAKPLLTRRCVIPSTGFYEWAFVKAYEEQMSLFPDAGELKPSPKDKKIKLLFRRPGESMLYMAGMIRTSIDANGAARDCFCILTTEAKHSIARFHERMPLILSADECEDWIADETFMRQALVRDGPDLDWNPAA